MREIIVVSIVVVLSLSGAASAQTDLNVGKRAYALCAGCHGFEAQGNELIGAPGLAGLEDWYLERQIELFASGRGSQHSDGQRMAVMVEAIDSERELTDLVAYITTLPVANRPPTVTGDTERGRALYALCAACHGLEGRGNQGVSAPAVAWLDDWYFVEQLRLYAEGLRGTEPGNVPGQQMRALASSFDTDDERRDLAAYVNSLRTD